jgi:hypothetical protein
MWPHANKHVLPQADDELEAPYLAGFEWDKDECYTRFVVSKEKGQALSTSMAC